jgi:hypothetical protein
MLTPKDILKIVENFAATCEDEILEMGLICFDGDYWIRPVRTLENIKGSPLVRSIKLSNHAERQLLQKLEIPSPYFHRCPTSLQEQNFNYWRDQYADSQLMLRQVGEDRVRAVMSNRYVPIDDVTAVPVVLETLAQDNVVYSSFCKADEITAMRVIWPELAANHNFRSNIEIVAGLLFVNSEVGIAAVRLQPTIQYRYNMNNYGFKNFYYLSDTKNEGCTAIRHLAELDPQRLREGVDLARRAAQAGIAQMISADHKIIQKPFEEMQRIVENNVYIPNGVLAILEEEWQDELEASKLQVATAILESLNKLPAFQEGHDRMKQSLDIEQSLGRYLDLFNKTEERIGQVLALNILD